MQFQVFDTVEGSSFTQDEVSWIQEILFDVYDREPLGNLTAYDFTPDKPGALDITYETTDDNNYDASLDAVRQNFSSLLDVLPAQIGSLALTVNATDMAVQFQVLPKYTSASENCSFAENEVDRIQDALTNRFSDFGTVSNILYDSGDCGHFDATVTITSADSSEDNHEGSAICDNMPRLCKGNAYVYSHDRLSWMPQND